MIDIDEEIERTESRLNALKKKKADREQALANNTCILRERKEHEGFYASSCIEIWQEEQFIPTELIGYFKYCPYCGKKIVRIDFDYEEKE